MAKRDLQKTVNRGNMITEKQGLGDYPHEISRAVLDNGTRVLVERSMANALGKKGGGAYREKKKSGEKSALLPEYISLKNLQPYISEELQHEFDNPIAYIDKQNRIRTGVEATILSDICDVWIAAKEKGALTSKQEETARRAYILGVSHMTVNRWRNAYLRAYWPFAKGIIPKGGLYQLLRIDMHPMWFFWYDIGHYR